MATKHLSLNKHFGRRVFQRTAPACKPLYAISVATTILTSMKTNDNRLECYDKMFPKWANILLATVVFVSAFYFFKYDTVAFYICIAMCLLLVVLTLTHKSTKEPKLKIDNYNIKTTLGQTYSIKSISNADLLVKGKWVRNKSNYIRLHFKNNTTTEFQVDYLDKKPKEIIDNLLSKILADT